MKLRIKGNSIRFRLGRAEARQLVDLGFVEETTRFQPGDHQNFGYALVSAIDLAAIEASFENGRIVVRVPAAMIRDWGHSDRLGIEAILPIEAGSGLRILIEKDLECLDAPAHESQADAFPRAVGDSPCSSSIASAPIEINTGR